MKLFTSLNGDPNFNTCNRAALWGPSCQQKRKDMKAILTTEWLEGVLRLEGVCGRLLCNICTAVVEHGNFGLEGVILTNRQRERHDSVTQVFFLFFFFFLSLFTKETRQMCMRTNICTSGKKRNYKLQTPSLGDAWFTSSVEVKIAKEQASNEVHSFWITQFWKLYLNCKHTHVWFRASCGGKRDVLMISSPHSWSLRSPARQIHRSSLAGCWSCRHWGHSVRCCTAQWSLSAPFGRLGSPTV